MTYEAWRCTFQSAEAAARAAYGQVQGAVAEAAGLREKLEARCPGLVQIQEPAETAAPVVLPEPTTTIISIDEFGPCFGWLEHWAKFPVGTKLFSEQQVSTLLQAVAVHPAQGVQSEPDGWREKFSAVVYDDLVAADNQDVPLEEYPDRILKVLDSIVGPRHPTVIKWRNDAIKNCLAIAYKYCRDPESHSYLKQDLEVMLVTEIAIQPQAEDARDANQWLQAGDMEALERFAETSDDDQSYDIGKEAVKRLAHFGCLESLGFGRYGITAFGSYVIVDWVGSRKLPFTTQADRDTEHRAAIAAQAAKGETQ